MKKCFIQSLNTPMTLEKPAFTPDGGGGRHTQWISVAKVWAQIESHSAKEVQRDGRQVMQVLHHIYIAQRAELEATMRFAFGSKHYYITGFYLDERKSALLGRAIVKCHCEEYDSL